MELYHRLSDTELQAMPEEQQLEAWAFRNYLDAAAHGASKSELRLLGKALEIIICQGGRQEEQGCGSREILERGGYEAGTS